MVKVINCESVALQDGETFFRSGLLSPSISASLLKSGHVYNPEGWIDALLSSGALFLITEA